MKKNNLSDTIINHLANHLLGVLATCGDGYPHASLISLVFADDYASLIFPTLSTTRKYANLQDNRRVAVLLDNRSFETEPDHLYALTIHGSAHTVDATERTAHTERLLKVHPQLSGFILLRDTVLVKVGFEKITLVEGVQTVNEFLL